MKSPTITNPYLLGNFAPITSEDDFENLAITGEIPKELNGIFYRNGANPQFAPRDNDYHWFAGDGMIHAFDISEGKVSYRNRFVRTPKWEMENAAGKALFGTNANPLTTDVSVIGKDDGLANTSVVWHAGKLLACEEFHQPFEIEPGTLASKGYVPYGGKANRFTAHPKFDPETGELVFFAYMAGNIFSKKLAYGVVDKNGKVTTLDLFDSPYPSMVHDFIVTKNYVVFPVFPLTGSLTRAMMGGAAFGWEPSKGTHIGVMKRNANVNSIKWIKADPCYVFHYLNMWDKDGTIYADAMQYSNPPLFPNADNSPGKPANAKLIRWTIAPKGSSYNIKQELIDDASGEFPRFDDRLAGRPYRHGYFVASSTNNKETLPDKHFDSIAHIDLESKKRVTYKFPAGDVPGEPVFIPRSEFAGENEGWIVAIVYKGADDKSDFVVFDASDITAGPIGTASMPRRVPYGFHGTWVPR